MVALHAGVMYCTEITDALWKRYLSQHPENLIDEDSCLINFARTQSIRWNRSNEERTSRRLRGSQRISKFLSNRSHPSFKLQRSSRTSRSLNTNDKGETSSTVQRTMVSITPPTIHSHAIQSDTTIFEPDENEDTSSPNLIV
ncbi:hypothetical protein AB6A40_010934 [Gnathostoma spinigerum]|uniref:Uncharacterized protein n=1 Tax=Gnathostoma spinigerum TaxID=75299 RepID=A0ABD6F450_9BILA